jgi:hypothetical protein
MYYAMIALLMFILPIGSVLVERLAFNGPAGWAMLVGKWFVFWAMGLRLLIAGLRQTFNPAFTAKDIFGITSKEALVLVRELGFANLASGLLGTVSIFFPTWVAPAAFAGGIFYLLAGFQHVRQPNKGGHEYAAMISDLFIGAVLLLAILAIWRS